MKKINYKNVFKLIIFVICLGIIVYDLYMLIIYPLISGVLTGWTLFGFTSFVASIYICVDIYDQIKNVSNTGTVKHTTK